jgi:TPR repeat protein
MGDGLKKDDSKAYEYLNKACELEPKNGQYVSTLARISYYDYKVNDNILQLSGALELFKKACALKEVDSCNALGSIYETGEDAIEVDFAKSEEYYKKSCVLKNSEGCNKLKTAKNR